MALTEQEKIVKQWKSFATISGKDAYKDLMEYIDAQMAMYLKYCEDQAMPHPRNTEQVVPLSNDMISTLLQNRRGLGIVKTYIQSRVESDVAQSTK